jgi:2-methylcitrate dehydratase PrpD
MNATETLASFVPETVLEDIPADVRSIGKYCILDAIGCALGGIDTPIGRAVIDTFGVVSGQSATVLGGGRLSSPWDAAFVNATLVNALDYDDGNGAGHPSATVFPAALASAEDVHGSGRELLLSFLLGHETSTRVGRAIRPSRTRRQVAWGIGTHQTFGAAAAAGKVIGLDKLGLMNAFGIAGAGSPVPSAAHWGWRVRPLTWVKDAVAWPAHAGVVSARLANNKFAGCKDILDGDTGFWAMAGSDKCDFSKMVGELGKTFYLREATFKPYSSCRYTHAPLDAIQLMLDENAIEEDEIEAIEIRSIADLAENFMDYSPVEMVDAQFSLPYAAAMVVGRHPPGPSWFTDEIMKSSATRRSMEKVRCISDRYADDQFFASTPAKFVASVTIKLVNGRSFDRTVEYPRGQPENPLSTDFLEDKFKRLAMSRLGLDRASRLMDRILAIEGEEDIRATARLMQPDVSGNAAL